MKLISLALFGTQTRYWYTLLTAMVSNLELYPGFSIRLYISNDVRQHPASALLDELSDRLPIQIFEFPGAYTETEPSMWRMRALWDSNVELFICRDIDSVPSTEEIQATRLWLNSTKPVHSIRSFHLHDTLLMAGLCGFRNLPLQFAREQITSFDHYVNLYRQYASQCPNFVWGCDQEALRMLCNNMRALILDCPIGNCRGHDASLGITTPSKEEIYAVSVSDLNQPLLKICDEITAIPWDTFKGFAGRPQGDTRSQLQEILKLDLPSCLAVRDIFDKKPDIKAIYKP